MGTPSTIVTATSTTWTVTPFGGLIDGEALAIAGPYGYAFDTNQTGGVTAAGASARVDRLDVQVSDPAESDGSSAPGMTVVYTAGTPGLVAAPARSHPLAQINVPATGGGSPTVTWTATYSAAAGGVATFATFAALYSWATAADGQLAYALDTGNLWEYIATAPTPDWYHVGGRPVVGAFSPTGIYSSGTPAVRVLRGNGFTSLDGIISSSTASFVVGTIYTVGSIPAAMAPASTQTFATVSNISDLVWLTISSSGGITIVLNGGNFTGVLNLSVAGVQWRTKGLS
jgi:hypothetical protein